MRVLNFFRFYMPINIAYFRYIFGDNGANMLQMVLSTENDYYTNSISLVMLLVAQIPGLIVIISRFS